MLDNVPSAPTTLSPGNQRSLLSVTQPSVLGAQRIPFSHCWFLSAHMAASDSGRTSTIPPRTGSMVLIFQCSPSFAALKDSSKRSINSDWKIELPGEFQIAGTTVRYVRRGLWEKFSAKGPTTVPLHLMVSAGPGHWLKLAS